MVSGKGCVFWAAWVMQDWTIPTLKANNQHPTLGHYMSSDTLAFTEMNWKQHHKNKNACQLFESNVGQMTSIHSELMSAFLLWNVLFSWPLLKVTFSCNSQLSKLWLEDFFSIAVSEMDQHCTLLAETYIAHSTLKIHKGYQFSLAKKIFIFIW